MGFVQQDLPIANDTRKSVGLEMPAPMPQPTAAQDMAQDAGMPPAAPAPNDQDSAPVTAHQDPPAALDNVEESVPEAPARLAEGADTPADDAGNAASPEGLCVNEHHAGQPTEQAKDSADPDGEHQLPMLRQPPIPAADCGKPDDLPDKPDKEMSGNGPVMSGLSSFALAGDAGKPTLHDTSPANAPRASTTAESTDDGDEAGDTGVALAAMVTAAAGGVPVTPGEGNGQDCDCNGTHVTENKLAMADRFISIIAQQLDAACKAMPADAANDAWAEPVAFEAANCRPIPLEAIAKAAPILAAYIREVADAVQVSTDGVTLAVLAAMATALRGVAYVTVHADHRIYLNLYALALAQPGDRKSFVVECAKAPLEEASKEEEETGAKVRAKRQAEMSRIKKRLSRVEDELARIPSGDDADDEARQRRARLIAEQERLGAELEAHVPIAKPKLFVDDVTQEALAALMAGQRGVIAIMLAEGRLFDLLAGYYSHGMANTDLVKKAWSGESYISNRKTSGEIRLPHPILNMFLFVQPEVMRNCAGKPFRGEGLLARFIFAVPASRIGERGKPRALDAGIKARYAERLRTVHAATSTPPDDAERAVMPLRLSPEAAELLDAFEARIEPMLAAGNELHPLQDWAAKLPSNVVRMAGLIHMFQEGGERNPTVDGACMRAALEVASVLDDHARTALGLLGQDPGIEAASFLWGHIVRRRDMIMGTMEGRFTARNALQWSKGASGMNTMKGVRRALDVLIERSYIVPLDREKAKPGRPASDVYAVNPKALALEE